MKKSILIVSCLALIFASCVPKRQLISEQKRVKELKNDSVSTHNKLSDDQSANQRSGAKIMAEELTYFWIEF